MKKEINKAVARMLNKACEFGVTRTQILLALDRDEGLTIAGISDSIGCADSTVNSPDNLQSLLEKGFVERSEFKPRNHFLTKKGREKLNEIVN